MKKSEQKVQVPTDWSVHVFCQLYECFSLDFPSSRIEIAVIEFKYNATLL